MATEIELAKLDAAWMRNEAQKASDVHGSLDPARVDKVRRFLGGTTGEIRADLAAALAGTYEGTPEGGRRLLNAPGIKHRRAERKRISVVEAAVELSGTDSAAGSERIADLADRLVDHERTQGREISYAEALVEVQRPGARAGEPPRRRAEGSGEDAGPDTVELAGFTGMGRTNFKPEAWVRTTILHLEDRHAENPDPTKHALPIRKPDGTLSLQAMKEAGRKLIVMEGVPPEKKREAARELIRAYRRVDDNPPDSLAALAGDTYARGFAEDGGMEDAGEAGDREDVRIADRADEYAERNQVPYEVALVEVQRKEK